MRGTWIPFTCAVLQDQNPFMLPMGTKYYEVAASVLRALHGGHVAV